MKFPTARLMLLAFSLTIPAAAADVMEFLGLRWSVPVSSDWKIEPDGGVPALHLLVARPRTSPRRPFQFALAQTPDYKRVTVEADVKRNQGSLILVYAYQDDAHFNYAHLSIDAPAAAPHHNGIFHVYGGERVRISNVKGPGSLPTTDWHHVRLDFDGETGRVSVLVNGRKFPSLEGVDLSLTEGKVGIGSFFETASFKNVKITGVPAAAGGEPSR